MRVIGFVLLSHPMCGATQRVNHVKNLEKKRVGLFREDEPMMAGTVPMLSYSHKAENVQWVARNKLMHVQALGNLNYCISIGLDLMVPFQNPIHGPSGRSLWVI